MIECGDGAPREPAAEAPSEAEGGVEESMPSTARRFARGLLMLADRKHVPIGVFEPRNFVAVGRSPDS